MGSHYKLALAGLVGLALGAAGMDAIHAQTAVAPAFLVANIKDVKDQANYDKYRAAVVGTQTPLPLKSAGLPRAICGMWP